MKIRRGWQGKEKEDAVAFGGVRTPRSGGFWSFPGDVKAEIFLLDSKDTNSKSYSVTEAVLKKLQKEALLSERFGVLSVRLGTGREFVVLDKNDFIEIMTQFALVDKVAT